MTISVWLEYAYYDGVLCFARGVATADGVVWMGVPLPVVGATR